MTRLIDADALAKVKFHGYPEIEITPSDVNAETYKRGWNDAIDAIIENGPSIDAVPVKHGTWVQISPAGIYECSECGKNVMTSDIEAYKYCHGCGARMDGEENE